jgi:hypothetical protein
MDYKQLLRKYMRQVADREGFTFVYKGAFLDEISAEEEQELIEIDKHLYDQT